MSVNERDLPKEIQTKLQAIRSHEAACLDMIDGFLRESDTLAGHNVERSDFHEFRSKVNGAAATIARAAKELRDDVKRPHVDRILQEREEADQA